MHTEYREDTGPELTHALNSDTLLTSKTGADPFAVIAESKQPAGLGAEADCWIVTQF